MASPLKYFVRLAAIGAAYPYRKNLRCRVVAGLRLKMNLGKPGENEAECVNAVLQRLSDLRYDPIPFPQSDVREANSIRRHD